MKLLVNIDLSLIEEVMKVAGVKTKKEAVIIPMQEYLRKRKIEELACLIGKAPTRQTLSDLLKSRKKWR